MLNSFYSWAYNNLSKKVYRFLRKPYSFYLNYFRDETHIYRTGVERGKWADHTYRLPYVMRNAFLTYVEDELLHSWNELDENSSYEEILDHLEWQEENNGYPKAVDTYKYLKKRRPELVELDEKTLHMGYGDLEFTEDGINLGDSDKEIRDFHHKVEEHLHNMDQKYLHRIVDLIPYLWT